MITNDSDYEADDLPSGLLEGLEQLALALDAERYPGPAWPPVPVPRPSRVAAVSRPHGKWRPALPPPRALLWP